MNGLDMNLVITTHIGAGDVHMCVSLNSSKKNRVFTELPVTEEVCEEHSLKRNSARVDESVALGIMEKEIRLARREKRALFWTQLQADFRPISAIRMLAGS